LNFVAKLRALNQKNQSLLCIGLDPDPEVMPHMDVFEFIRCIAVARILMPASLVRLSAGRQSLSDEAQAMCFLAGANSIFYGERLLTTDNPEADADRLLFDRLGLHPMEVGL